MKANRKHQRARSKVGNNIRERVPMKHVCVQEVDCPTCHAGATYPCVASSGKDATETHMARLRAWENNKPIVSEEPKAAAATAGGGV
jgi:hypothetical protein